MSKKIGVAIRFAGVCALSLFLLSCGSSSSRPSGLLYVLTQGNNGVGNNVTSYAIDLGNGNLSEINSNASTCATGSDCGAPLSIVLDPTGAAAFVLNQGVPCSEVFDPTNNVWVCDPTKNAPVAPTIYPYTVNSDGSLSAPGGAVTWSCGAASACANSDLGLAMSRDAAGQFLFVVDQGSNPTPGTATPPVYPSCPHVPTGPTDVCPSISVFKMSSTGLTLASGSPFYLGRIPTALSAITLSSPAEELLFVTSNHDLSLNHNDNTLSVYGVASDGTLSEQTGSPYITPTIDPLTVLAVNTNLTGQNSAPVFVYSGAAGNASGAVDAFQLCTTVNATCTQTDVNNAKLLPVGTPISAGQEPVGMVVDPTNNFLYVVAEQSNQLFGFKINVAGTLSPLSPASLPTGSTPVALAMHSTGKFLYTSNTNSNNISPFTLSTTSGSMAAAASAVNTPSVPSGMTAR
jgi:6-phosphogluconolactonase (cycloisomerase 2 family)